MVAESSISDDERDEQVKSSVTQLAMCDSFRLKTTYRSDKDDGTYWLYERGFSPAASLQTISYVFQQANLLVPRCIKLHVSLGKCTTCTKFGGQPSEGDT